MGKGRHVVIHDVIHDMAASSQTVPCTVCIGNAVGSIDIS